MITFPFTLHWRCSWLTLMPQSIMNIKCQLHFISCIRCCYSPISIQCNNQHSNISDYWNDRTWNCIFIKLIWKVHTDSSHFEFVSFGWFLIFLVFTISFIFVLIHWVLKACFVFICDSRYTFNEAKFHIISRRKNKPSVSDQSCLVKCYFSIATDSKQWVTKLEQLIRFPVWWW